MDLGKFYLEINTDFKPYIVKRRREFMDLLLKCLVDEGNEKAENDLLMTFGTRLVTGIDRGQTLTMIVDGTIIHKV